MTARAVVFFVGWLAFFAACEARSARVVVLAVAQDYDYEGGDGGEYDGEYDGDYESVGGDYGSSPSSGGSSGVVVDRKPGNPLYSEYSVGLGNMGKYDDVYNISDLPPFAECVNDLACRTRLQAIRSGLAKEEDETKDKDKPRSSFEDSESLYVFLHILFDEDKCNELEEEKRKKESDGFSNEDSGFVDLFGSRRSSSSSSEAWFPSIEASKITLEECEYSRAWNLTNVAQKDNDNSNKDAEDDKEISKLPHIYHRTCVSSDKPNTFRWRSNTMFKISPPYKPDEYSPNQPSPPLQFLNEFGNGTGTWFFWKKSVGNCNEASVESQIDFFFGRGDYLRRGTVANGWYGKGVDDFEPEELQCDKCVYLHQDSLEYYQGQLLYTTEYALDPLTRTRISRPGLVVPYRIENPGSLGQVLAFKVGKAGGGKIQYRARGTRYSLSKPTCVDGNCTKGARRGGRSATAAIQGLRTPGVSGVQSRRRLPRISRSGVRRGQARQQPTNIAPVQLAEGQPTQAWMQQYSFSRYEG